MRGKREQEAVTFDIFPLEHQVEAWLSGDQDVSGGTTKHRVRLPDAVEDARRGRRGDRRTVRRLPLNGDRPLEVLIGRLVLTLHLHMVEKIVGSNKT